MRNEEQERKITLDHMIDEKFGEIFFLAKDEYDIKNNTSEERIMGFFRKIQKQVKKEVRETFCRGLKHCRTPR